MTEVQSVAHDPGWIGVDLDGTLALYGGWNGGHIGPPIPPMVERVKAWLEEGREVRIVTARVGIPLPDGDFPDWAKIVKAQTLLVQDWCEEHIGVRLRVTASKDYRMAQLWDDRAVQVIPNTGMTVEDELEQTVAAFTQSLRLTAPALVVCPDCPQLEALRAAKAVEP